MSDFSRRKLLRQFLSYALPSILSMWVYTIYTMVDGIFVARGVGENALAAINVSMPLINIAFGLSILFAVGASTKASIFKGAGLKKKADNVFTLSTTTVFFLACIFSLFSYLNLDRLARLLGSTNENHMYVIDYLSIILLFIPFYMTAYNLEVLIKADGFPRKAVFTTLAGAFINIVLDYFFVIVFSFGIKGAALATGLSQLISFIIFFAHFLSNKGGFTFRKYPWSLSEALELAKIGGADSLTEFSIALMIFVFNHILFLVSGNDALIIFSLISYIYQLVLMTMIGLNQGMQPLISFYYGRKDKKSYRYIFKISIFSAGILSVLAFFISYRHTGLIVSQFISFDKNPLIFGEAIEALRLFSLAFIPMGWVVVFYGYFTSLEKIKASLLISLSRGLVFPTISLSILALTLGEKGVWISMALSELSALLLAFFLYLKIKGTLKNKLKKAN